MLATSLFLTLATRQDSLGWNDLAGMLAKLSSQPAMVLLPAAEKIDFLRSADSYEALTDDLKRKGYNTSAAGVAVVYKNGIPPNRLGILAGFFERPSTSSLRAIEIPANALKDGNLTFETKPGEAIFMGGLSSIKAPKAVVVNPYFIVSQTDYPMAMKAKDAPVLDVLKAVAKAAGGKLTINAKTYSIDFDAANFKNQVQTVLTKATKAANEGKTPRAPQPNYADVNYDYQRGGDSSGPSMATDKTQIIAALGLLGQTIQSMSPDLVEQTFAYTNSKTRLNLNVYRNLQQPLVQFFSTLKPKQGNTKNENPNAANVANILPRISRTKPGNLVITTDFRLIAELNVQTGANANQTNTVSLQIL
jgi:hypothetical protein